MATRLEPPQLPLCSAAYARGKREGENGEGKVTRLELFAEGIVGREPLIWDLIRVAA